ncbi:hypothetical protein PIB30_025286 [Stylosanthes scabra]|uniref:Uncharacterized protein n=1 Tax=Stylosanthes scabra TaxID=79078 RepID=A0ABU6VA90_9FABA|nr:hypothetical protein [Stylosanthes scabra]
MLDGLSSPGFQQVISEMLLEGDGCYRPDTQFDGSQVHLDLNEPVSSPSHVFMALGGTLPSAAHVPGGSWEVPFMEPSRLPTPLELGGLNRRQMFSGGFGQPPPICVPLNVLRRFFATAGITAAKRFLFCDGF